AIRRLQGLVGKRCRRCRYNWYPGRLQRRIDYSHRFSGSGCRQSSVDIAQVKYGGTIGAIATASLKDVNHADYGGGMAKDITARINFIRGLQENDPLTADSTLLEGVYATAKTTFKAADMVAADYTGGTVAAVGYTYVGAGTITNGQLEINGVDIGPVTFTEKDATGSLTDAINAKSNVTGVTASIDNGELILTAEDGRDILITTASAQVTNALFGGGGTSATGEDEFAAAFTTLHVTGAVTVSAQDTLSFLGTGPVEAGFLSSLMTSENVQAVGSISNTDITTRDSANTVLDSTDSALKQVDDLRARLGAVQNRLESTIANLMNVAENLTAARSQTMDADFAQETANLTRAQILQQAGVAMLAQANMLPQTVLSLLQ
ncbi:MAG: flagellin, partial [Desulfobacterales bacterium]|nr:flagellin [Desulfobacterales bacterium]